MTERSLAHIVCDLRLANKERNEADVRCMAADNRPNRFANRDRDAEEDFASADDRLAELKQEFKREFRRVTGVSWTTVEDLNL